MKKHSLDHWSDEALAELANRVPMVAAPLAASEIVDRQQAAKGGNTAGSSKSSTVPKGHNAAIDGYSGPRIVINPSTFKNEKDALCVAFDEAFRIVMEMNGFDPQSEPTEKQRKFFSDTEYANDERMLRRTILARICTFDTSVSDPTDEQLQEAVEFLDTVMEIGAPQNEWEQRSVQRIRDAIAKTVGQPRAPEETPEPPAEGPGNAAAGGGETEDEEDLFGQNGTVETTDRDVADFVNSAVQEPDNFGANGTVETTDQDVADFIGTANGDAAEDGTTAMGNNVNEFVASAQEAGLKADIAEAQKPGNMPMKNGHYVGSRGEYLSERQAKELAERNVRNGVERPNVQQQQNIALPQQNSLADDGTGIGDRKLTAGELAWRENRRKTTEKWRRRTGRTEEVFA